MLWRAPTADADDDILPVVVVVVPLSVADAAPRSLPSPFASPPLVAALAYAAVSGMAVRKGLLALEPARDRVVGDGDACFATPLPPVPVPFP